MPASLRRLKIDHFLQSRQCAMDRAAARRWIEADRAVNAAERAANRNAMETPASAASRAASSAWCGKASTGARSRGSGAGWTAARRRRPRRRQRQRRRWRRPTR